MGNETELFVREIEPDFSTTKYLKKTLMLINKFDKYSQPYEVQIGVVKHIRFSKGDVILRGVSLKNYGGIVFEHKPYLKIFNSILYEKEEEYCGKSLLSNRKFPISTKFYLFDDIINSLKLIDSLDVRSGRKFKSIEILLESSFK